MPQAAMNACSGMWAQSELINQPRRRSWVWSLCAPSRKHNGSLHIEPRNVGDHASRSRRAFRSAALCCEPEAYKLGPAALYTAFANCLPEDFFAGKYMD